MIRFKTPLSTGEAPAASLELKSSNQAAHGEGVREEKEHKAPDSQQPKTVLQLSFSEDHSFSRAAFSEDQNVSELPTAHEQSFLEETFPEESKEKVSKISAEDRSESWSLEEKLDSSSYSEGEIEPSTDEELKMWRYPEGKTCEEQETCVKEEEGGDFDHLKEPADMRDGGCSSPADEVTGDYGIKEDKEPQPEEDERLLDDNRDQEKSEVCQDEVPTGETDVFTIKQEQKEKEGIPLSEDVFDQTNESQTDVAEEDMDLESAGTDSNLEGNNADAQVDLSDVTDDARRPTEHPDVGRGSGEKEQDVLEVSDKAEGGESSKKVTFILEPELIDSPTLSEATESSLSGESSLKMRAPGMTL